MSTTAQKIVAVALVCVGLGASPVRAQLSVIDAANLVVNTTTSFQQTLNTVQSVLQTGYMILEIAGIEELAEDGSLESDLHTLVMLIDEGARVAWDLQSITQQVHALFDLNSAPATTLELSERLREIRRANMEAYTTAVRVQTLIKTAMHTVTHIIKLLNRISGFVGNMQANQNINESLASLKRLETTQLTTNAAFQRGMTMQAMEKPLIEESMEKIKDAWCGRWCEGR